MRNAAALSLALLISCVACSDDASSSADATVDMGLDASAPDGSARDTTRDDVTAAPLFSDDPATVGFLTTITVERQGSQGRLDVDGLDVDASGRTFTSGFVTGTATFGPGGADKLTSTKHPQTGAFTKDLYLARYAKDGSLDWVLHFPSSSYEGNGYDLAVGRDRGEVYLSGAFAGSLTLPSGGPLTTGCAQGKALDSNSGANGQMALLAFDLDGALRWAVQADSKALVSGGNEISVDADGDVVQIGLYGSDDGAAVVEGCQPTAKRELALGGQTLPYDGGSVDSYVAVFSRLDGTLKHLPARIGGAGRQRGKAVDAAPATSGTGKDIVLGVDYIGPTTLYTKSQQETLSSTPLPSGKPSQDMLVARVGYDGSYRWHVGFGSSAHDEIKGVATSPDGHVVISGTLGGKATLGGVTLDPADVAAGVGTVGFVAQLDGKTGAVLWARVFGAEGGTSFCCEIVVDAAGNSYLSPGVVGNDVVFSDGTTAQRFAYPSDRYDPAAKKGLILKVSKDGTLVAARGVRHGDRASHTNSSELAVLGANVHWTGYFKGTLLLDQPLTSEDSGKRNTEFVCRSTL